MEDSRYLLIKTNVLIHDKITLVYLLHDKCHISVVTDIETSLFVCLVANCLNNTSRIVISLTGAIDTG